MPDFWEFPTVSMGIGPISAIYQARFNRYLHNRGQLDTSGSRVWAFLGDGETDEPESLGALNLAAREGLDNLTFVVNCNLQRLDGPVRGNGKIIQELEATFRGAGWNVIKVIWAREWDELLARDVDGLLVQQMNDTLDGEFQKFSVAGGAYIREHFFGPDQRLRKLVEHLSDDDLAKLRRGGHDYRKVYAAYRAATEFKGAPTVILAKTVKGWTLGPGVEARNITHQAKKLSEKELAIFRDRLQLPIPDAELKDAPYYHPGPKSEEVQYLRERRAALGGEIPKRVVRDSAAPGAGPGGRPGIRRRQPDRGLDDDGLHADPAQPDPRQGARAAHRPDHPRRGAHVRHGPAVQGGRHLRRPRPALRAGRLRSRAVVSRGDRRPGARGGHHRGRARWPASRPPGTSYATHGHATIPFYIFYSMFGFQRTGDQMWAFGDARGRGFLMGATAGRTTLAGEGLQHDDGHSHILASTHPVVRGYDPAFAYELAAIIRDGIERMYVKGEDLYYYISLYNENYAQPPKPDGVDEGILRGIYRFAEAPQVGKDAHPARLVGSGSILNQVIAARDLLAEKFGVAAEVYSAPSFPLLRRDALEAERWNRLHPDTRTPRIPYVTTVLPGDGGPIVAATDWMKALPDMVARWLPDHYLSLGTDGFGRSGTREDLRALFEIDPPHIAAATLVALARCGALAPGKAAKAVRDLGIDPDKIDPLAV